MDGVLMRVKEEEDQPWVKKNWRGKGKGKGKGKEKTKT
jgi:hypothetical protein